MHRAFDGKQPADKTDHESIGLQSQRLFFFYDVDFVPHKSMDIHSAVDGKQFMGSAYGELKIILFFSIGQRNDPIGKKGAKFFNP